MERLARNKLTISYQKGHNTKEADALSHLPVDDDERGTSFDKEVITVVTPCISREHLIDEVRKVVVLSQVMSFLQTTWPHSSLVRSDVLPYF